MTTENGSNSPARDRLRSFVERIEACEEQKSDIAIEIRAILNEAKSEGYDTKILRAVIKRRKAGEQATREFDQLLELYEGTIGGQMNLFEKRAEELRDVSV